MSIIEMSKKLFTKFEIQAINNQNTDLIKVIEKDIDGNDVYSYLNYNKFFDGLMFNYQFHLYIKKDINGIVILSENGGADQLMSSRLLVIHNQLGNICTLCIDHEAGNRTQFELETLEFISNIIDVFLPKGYYTLWLNWIPSYTENDSIKQFKIIFYE